MTDRPVSVTTLLSVAMVAFGIGWWAKPAEVREVLVWGTGPIPIETQPEPVTVLPDITGYSHSVPVAECQEPEPVPVPLVCRVGEWIDK
jgi:hypothetical protein